MQWKPICFIVRYSEDLEREQKSQEMTLWAQISQWEHQDPFL